MGTAASADTVWEKSYVRKTGGAALDRHLQQVFSLGFDPRHAPASRLRQQTFLLSDFLENHAHGYAPPKLSAKIFLHGHCHHKALMKMRDEEALLRRTGAELLCPDAGCCGMA